MDVGVKSLPPVAIWRVSGEMSSHLSSDTARSDFPEKSSGYAGNVPDTNHNATRLAAVEISGKTEQICCHLTPESILRESDTYRPNQREVSHACNYSKLGDL